jgi:hypothetical protein
MRARAAAGFHRFGEQGRARSPRSISVGPFAGSAAEPHSFFRYFLLAVPDEAPDRDFALGRFGRSRTPTACRSQRAFQDSPRGSHPVFRLHHAILVRLGFRQMEGDVPVELLQGTDPLSDCDGQNPVANFVHRPEPKAFARRRAAPTSSASAWPSAPIREGCSATSCAKGLWSLRPGSRPRPCS